MSVLWCFICSSFSHYLHANIMWSENIWNRISYLNIEFYDNVRLLVLSLVNIFVSGYIHLWLNKTNQEAIGKSKKDGCPKKFEMWINREKFCFYSIFILYCPTPPPQKREATHIFIGVKLFWELWSWFAWANSAYLVWISTASVYCCCYQSVHRWRFLHLHLKCLNDRHVLY